MSTLQFIASLVKSLAWPTAAVIAAVVFRKSITAVMQRFTRVKYKELEFEFKEELKSIASALSPTHSLITEAELSGASSLDVKGEVKAVAEVSPRAAIPLAWGSVEAELQEALFRVADSPVDVPMFNIRQQLAGLQQRGFLDAETARGIHRLRELRNRIVHGDLSLSNLSEKDAWNYAELAATAGIKLRSIKR